MEAYRFLRMLLWRQASWSRHEVEPRGKTSHPGCSRQTVTSKFLVGQYNPTINKRGENIGLFTQRKTMRYHLPDDSLSSFDPTDPPPPLFDECLVDQLQLVRSDNLTNARHENGHG